MGPNHHRPADRRRAPRAGFTLLELSIVVGIISLLTALALPIGRHLIVRARATAMANDLRVFAGAFQAYAAEHGDWPAGDGTPGVVPAGMESSLAGTHWQQPTPIGGHYTWDPNTTQQGSRYRAVIIVSSTPDSVVSRDEYQLTQVDRVFDDGNLGTGAFLLGYRQYPFHVLEH